MAGLTDSISTFCTANESFVSNSYNSKRRSRSPQEIIPTRSGFYGITIEPAMIFCSFGLILAEIFITNILIEKVCYNYFYYPKEVCMNLDSGNYSEEQENVQKITTRYTTYQHIIKYLPGVYGTLVMANWIEYKDKVLPLILSNGSLFLQSLLYLANSYWFSLHPAWLLVAEIPLGLTGGSMVILMTAYSIIADNSGTRSRTLRLSVILVTFNLSLPFGFYLGKLFYIKGGYNLVFSVQSIVLALNFAYIVMLCLYCKAELHPKDNDYEVIASVSDYGIPSTEDLRTLMESDNFERELASQEREVTSNLWMVLSPVWMVEKIRRPFRVEDKIRKQMLGLCFLYGFISYALTSSSYMFLYTRLKFSWTYAEYTNYIIFTYLLASAGTVVIVPLFSYFWQLSDNILNAAANVSIATGVLMIALAPNWIYLYIASLSSIIGGISPFTYVRSSLSKLVGGDQLITLLAILGTLGSIIPVISSVFDTLIYNWTIDSFPGTVFVISSCMHILAAATLWWINRIATREKTDLNEIQDERSSFESSSYQNEIPYKNTSYQSSIRKETTNAENSSSLNSVLNKTRRSSDKNEQLIREGVLSKSLP